MTRILVVDDSPNPLDLTVKALAAAGFECASATDLASLDQQLSTGGFDLFLVEAKLPDLVDFLTSQTRVKAKLVLYSDLPDADLAARANAARAEGYIVKSRGIEVLIQEVARLVGTKAPVAAGPARSSGPEPVAGGPKKKRVLIVDDSEMTARLLEAELSAKGFEVYTADTADKATKIILKKQTRPDLVLLDVRMPNVNGEQFCRFIKGNSLFKGIKVLLCSGENPEELQRICREAGADGYVPKDAVLGKVLSKELPE